MSSESRSCSRRRQTEPRFWAAAVLVFSLLAWAALRLIPSPPAVRVPLRPVEIAATVIAIEFRLPGPININTASAEQLQELPGIGPALAARIIAFREEHGPFATIEDLTHVSGIGPRTLDALRDLITVIDER